MAIKQCVVCGGKFDTSKRSNSAKTCSPEHTKEKDLQYGDKYRESNHEKRREWWTNNREKAREYNRKYREADPEKAREANRKTKRKRWVATPEKVREYSRVWRERNREKSREQERARATKLRRALRVLKTLGVEL